MSLIAQTIDRWFPRFFNERLRKRFELIILYLALGGFLIHLSMIIVQQMGWVTFGFKTDGLLDNALDAIYTPFSFILVYEVFSLVYFLPDSFTTAIGKQYEIISLVVIRRIFKDISKLNISEDWALNSYNINLTADMIGVLMLMFIIYWFYSLRKKRPIRPATEGTERFIRIKKGLTLALVPVIVGLAIYSLTNWIIEIREFHLGIIHNISDTNNVFYHEFFTLLILLDVAILIISFRFTDHYSLLIRNAGFVISTVLIRLSFDLQGENWQNLILIIAGVLFGTLIHWIYNLIAAHEEDDPMPHQTAEASP